jgi:hypothetical protein
LQAQILDIAFTAGVEKCRSKTFSILSTMGLPFFPPLRFIAILSFIQFYLFYVHQYEKSCFPHFIPVTFICHRIISPLCENMYNTFELFIPENVSGNLFDATYFMLA